MTAPLMPEYFSETQRATAVAAVRLFSKNASDGIAMLNEKMGVDAFEAGEAMAYAMGLSFENLIAVLQIENPAHAEEILKCIKATTKVIDEAQQKGQL
jgi:hypothetical protein